MTDETYPDALPAGYQLHWYVLERVLGQGGFGITYLANDSNLDRRVAIKEYLPTEIARRRSDASARPHTESHAERYAWGLERFLSEARTLARFDHPHIVRVNSIFEANNTAYMVMRFEEGENLATLLERRGTLPERELMDCLLPILDGLQLVHTAGFIHRDIKPENIYVRQDGSPVLLDFGSARKSFGSSKTMTILVAPGYAPLEQYYGDAANQGPWTDIYALGATCYRAIAGRAPLDAIARAKGVLGSARDILQPALEVGHERYSDQVLAAVDHSLQLSERDRPQNIAEWRREIVAPAMPGQTDRKGSVEPDQTVRVARQDVPHTSTVGPAKVRRLTVVWGSIVGMGVAAAVLAYLMPTRGNLTVRAPDPPVQPAFASPTVPSVTTKAVPAELPATPPPESVASDGPPVATTKSAAIEVPVVRHPASREPRPQSHPPARPEAQTSTLPGAPAVAPDALVMALPSAEPAVALVATPSPKRDSTSSTRSVREEQIDAADLALQRGDHAAAIQMLAPWAAAGIPRAQVLLGRSQEARSGRAKSDFEAYVWYSMAARGGEPDAQAMKDKVAAKLQPAEIRQAQQIVERWKPRAEPASAVVP